MRLLVFTLGIAMGMASIAVAAGDIFYDRFNTYCFNPKEDGTCPRGDKYGEVDPIADVAALRRVWVWTSWNYNTHKRDGANMTLEDKDELLYIPPYGGKCPNGGDEGNKLGQNTVDLTSYINAVFPGSNVVSGTDLNPLVLRFHFTGGIGDSNAVEYSNGYMELALDDAQAPTDYVMVGVPEVDDCASCFWMCPSPHYSAHVPWPTICQSYEARTASPRCPPAQTNVRSAIAIGALAMLDNNPCHCEDYENQEPHNIHLSYYDGWKWRILRSGIFSGSGDFVMGDKLNYVQITIRSETIDIYHQARVEGIDTISTATNVPRLYTGAFNKLRGGTGEGCELMNGAYNCFSPRKPIRMGEFRCDGGGWQSNKSKFISFDRVRLLDGVGGIVTYTGACCLPNATCAIGSAAECASQGGVYQGDGKTCQEVTCCPIPFADADTDGDVDQLDFGLFQACFAGPHEELAGGCECFDRDGDGFIDTDDFLAFNTCFSGPSVPADPACENAP